MRKDRLAKHFGFTPSLFLRCETIRIVTTSNKKGYYFLFTVEAPVAAINEYNHVANVNEDIIRSLVVKVEE